MRKITKIRRSVKAISPVISVLLMIAIAVASALVAYAWVMGYMDSTTTKVGKTIQIQSISEDAVYVQNIGEGDVDITDVYVDGTLVTTYTMDPSDGILTPSATASIVFDDAFNTQKVTIKVVTSDGVSAELTETFP